CADPARVASFWAGALGYTLVDADPGGAYDADPSGRVRGLFFQPVPEPKTVKNRVHLDLRAPDTMAAEVERIGALGATQLRYVEEGAGWWTVMADPEGNEFCVLRGAGEGGRRTTPGLDSVVVDCGDPFPVAAFWIEALGYREHERGDTGIEIVGPRPGDPMLSFVTVPEPKTVKNRLHLDVRPTDTMATEVQRVETLGATQLRYVEEGGSRWTVMADLEGNEFCVLRGPGDGWSPAEL
ncbi:MAG TPA: VOC family protein, partial [Actinomycetota bacterium]